MNDTKTTKSTKAKDVPKPNPNHPKRIKLRAVQSLFDGVSIVDEGEVYWFSGPVLPADEIAVPVDAVVPVGKAPDTPASKDPPLWSTKGYVDDFNRRSGRDADEEEQP